MMLHFLILTNRITSLNQFEWVLFVKFLDSFYSLPTGFSGPNPRLNMKISIIDNGQTHAELIQKMPNIDRDIHWDSCLSAKRNRSVSLWQIS